MGPTGKTPATIGRQPDAFDRTVTVFTPTYNRATTLPRVYESLQNQTFTDFEWLIVDDNSEDETQSLVEGWEGESEFPITLHVQEQPGKHRAHNIALERATGRFFLILDSDDRLKPDAIERFLNYWEAVPEERRDDVLGINALCTDQHGSIVGTPFPENGMYASHLEELYRINGEGDRVTFDRTAVLRAFPFPDIDGVRYLPESIVWGEIARHGFVRYCVNEPLVTYIDREDGRTDQLTQDQTTEHSLAFYHWHCTRLNDHLNWLVHAPKLFLTSAAAVTKHGYLSDHSFRQQWADLDGPVQHLLWLSMFPLGLLAAKRVSDRAG